MNQTAQGLASFGRGPDSMLVHMAPGEVKSLQQLAMAHGGSLTINPDTGLPEAGFLSSLLPMLIGAGVSMIPGVGPLMAAGLVGGGYGLATGSLKEGLKAGLGAYGGAGLGSALAGAGVQASVAPQLAQTQAGIAELAGAVPASGLTPAMVPDYAASILGKTQPYVDASNAATTAFQNAGPLEKLKTMGSGLSNLGSGAGRDAFMTQIGGTKGLGMAGLAAAAPMLLETTTKQPDIKQDTSLGQRYKFNAGTQTPTPNPDVPGYDNQGRNFGKEQKYFSPSYMPIDDATAKSMYGYASGGPVEAMSDANAIGMNTGYPQAAIDTGAYATPYQQPISRNVVTGPQGVGMNPYTGQAQFAEGGEVDEYTYDPVTQLYIKKSGQGATTVAPIKSISEVREGGGGGRELGAAINNPGGVNTNRGLVESVLSSPTLGRMVNAFGDKQDPAPVESRGTSTTPGSETGDSDSGGGFTDVGGLGAAAAADADAGGYMARGGIAALADGGISHLGDYSDGGRLLRGPGDGISDSIPAMIGKKQPARLADGEFVVPARIVSELGNGSTEAGARKLYAMMDRIQKARGKTVGKGKVAANSRSAKYLPA
jgi:hypothetical protein